MDVSILEAPGQGCESIPEAPGWPIWLSRRRSTVNMGLYQAAFRHQKPYEILSRLPNQLGANEDQDHGHGIGP